MRSKLERRFWSKVKKSRGRGCFLWISTKDDRGYGLFWWEGKYVRAHRMAYELAYGPLPPGALACHHCDTPACVRASHLFAGSHADNAKDASMKGLGSGERLRKLTWPKVNRLRVRYQQAELKRGLITALAAEVGVSRVTMSRILAGKAWARLSPPTPSP